MQSQRRIIKETISRIAVSRIYQIGYRQYNQTYHGQYLETKQAREHFDLLVVVDGKPAFIRAFVQHLQVHYAGSGSNIFNNG